MPDKVRVAFQVPLDAPIDYPIAQVAGSAQAAEGRRFIAYRAVAGRPGSPRPPRLPHTLSLAPMESVWTALSPCR